MIGTILTVLMAIYLLFFHPDIPVDPTVLESGMIATAILFFFLVPLLFAFSWGPLHQAEQNITPRILEMFRKDWQIKAITTWLIFFPFVTFFLAVYILPQNIGPRYVVQAIWLVLLGISIDLLVHLSRRILNYLNPFSAIEMFRKEANESIQDEREIDLCHWLDGLSEVAIKAIHRGSTALANEALTEQQQIARLFLTSSKSIGHHEQDKQTEEYGITDKVSYTMFFLYQRLEMVFEKALHNKVEPICSHTISVLGKIAVDAAKFDITMATAPLRYLGKFINRAEDEGLEDVALKGSCTLLEVAKMILTEIDITYCELQDPFLSIINSLEELSKKEFKRNRFASLKLLVQPFYELKAMFSEGKAAAHQDTPVIMQNIDRVIGEFDALEMVMRTIPTINPEKSSQGA